MAAVVASPQTPSAIPKNANAQCVGPQHQQAGKANSCAGCPNQQACQDGAGRQVDPAIQQAADTLAQVRHIVMVLSGKGGVGKSTFASQMAWTLAERGYQVGLLDCDITGPSAPRMTNTEEHEVRKSNYGWAPVYASEKLAVMSVAFMLNSKSDAIIWRGPRKNGLIKQFLTDVDWGELDFLIIDTPPGTSDEHLSLVTYLKGVAIDGAIVVTTPQEIALLDVRKEINFCKKTEIRVLGVVENMAGFVCPCCSTKSDIFPAMTGGARGMCEEMAVPFLGEVPLDPQMLRATERGECFSATYPMSPAVKPFQHCIDALLKTTCVDCEHESVASST